MKKLEPLISIRAFAKELQVDEKAVRKAIAEGKIKKGVDKKTGKIIPSVANAEWGHLHEIPKPQRGVSAVKAASKMEKKKDHQPEKTAPEKKVKTKKELKEKEILIQDVDGEEFNYKEFINSIKITPSMNYSEVILRKELLNAAEARMKLEEKEGALVSKAEVNKALYKVGDTIKKNLLNIPARIVSEIRASSNDVEGINLLMNELKIFLTSLAKLEYQPDADIEGS